MNVNLKRCPQFAIERNGKQKNKYKLQSNVNDKITFKEINFVHLIIV